MIPFFKRILLIILSLLLVILPCCGEDGHEPAISTTEEVVLNYVGSLDEYEIICQQNASVIQNRVAMSIRTSVMEKTSVRLNVRDDFILEGDDRFAVVEKEILIGRTNRPESAKALEGLAEFDYRIVVFGSKLVIAAHSDAILEQAATMFIKTFITEGDLRIPENYDVVYHNEPDSDGPLVTPLLSYSLNSIDGRTTLSDDGKHQARLINAGVVGGYSGGALRFYRNKKGGLKLGDGVIASLLNGKNAYTVSMWIESYPTYDEGYSFCLLSAFGEEKGKLVKMTYHNTGITVTVGSGEGKDDVTLTYDYLLSSRVTGTTPLHVNDGVWHMITLTVDLSTDSVAFYVNGKAVAPSSSARISFIRSTFQSAWTSVFSDLLGGDGDETQMSFNGVIDEFKLYDKALSAIEVAGLYGSYDEAETPSATSDQELIDEMLTKLGSAAVLKAGTGNIVWNGKVVKADTEDYERRNQFIGSTLYTPASFAERYFGSDVLTQVTQKDGYYSLKALCEAADKTYIDLTGTEDKLFIILSDDTTLNPDTDREYIARAGEFCEEYDNEPTVNVEQTRVEILYSNPMSANWIYSPAITTLNDVLYASCDISNGRYTEVFRSDDGGLTWKSTAKINQNFWWATLFTHNNELYLIGIYSTSYLGSERYIGITKSTDGGYTWTEMSTASGLVPYLGSTDWELHRAPTPVIVHDGKLWVVFEDVGEYVHPREVLMSASVDSDLLDPQNWTFYDHLSGHGWLLEGNPVVGPDGKMYVLSRTYTEKRIVLSQLQDGKLVYQNEYKFVDGASTKFTVRYDEKTEKYITLVNLFCGDDSIINNRTNLALISSKDMINWVVDEKLLCDRTVMNEMVSITSHAFQYVDWIIDGYDLLFTVRESMDDAKNWHDSNYLTFYRLSNYAQYVDGQ